jgi:sigma-B regulation protein RsbU (phosphoserine phosphatase)
MTRAISILVVDDDPIFAATATSLLAGVGRRIEVASDGVDALVRLETARYDLVLIDLTMPRIDGFRLIALIRATPRLRDLPILVVSSRGDTSAIAEATGLGISGYTTKPVDWIKFRAQIRAIFDPL